MGLMDLFRHLFTFSFFLLNSPLSAQELVDPLVPTIGLKQCMELGRLHGDPNLSTPMDRGCPVLVRQNASATQYAVGQISSELQAFTQENLLFLKASKDLKDAWLTIAGSETGLEQARAVAIGPLFNHLVVLGQRAGSDWLSTFRLRTGGNVAPLRSFTDGELKGADRLQIDLPNQRLLVANPSSDSVLAYNSHADVLGRTPEEQVNLLAKFSFDQLGLSKVQAILVDSEGDRYFFFDWDKGLYSVLPAKSMNLKELQTHAIKSPDRERGEPSAVFIEADDPNGFILVYKDGKNIRIDA